MKDTDYVNYPTHYRGFHIAHLNLRSMNNKFDLLKIHIQQMNFHIFTFSESWLTSSIPDHMIKVDGYNIVRLDREWKEDGRHTQKKGGGVGIYINEDLAYSTETLKEYNYSTKDIECLWVNILMKNSKDIIIGVVYRPPSGSVDVLCEKLSDSLEEIGNTYNKEIFILGDFNVNYLQKDNPHTKQLTQFEVLTGLKQIVNKPTRMGNCIDLIFSNSTDIANSGVVDVNLSDHDLIFATKKKTTPKREHIDFLGRSYRNYDANVFKNKLSTFDWYDYWLLDDPSLCWGYLLAQIQKEIDTMCPLKKRRVRNTNEPWLNNEILEAIFDKDQAWKQAKRSGLDGDLHRAKRLRNDVKDMIRRAKRNYVQDELNDENISAKKFWQKLNYILPSKERGNSISLVNEDNGEVIEDENLPDYINNFFIEIGPRLANRFTDAWVNNLPEFEGERIGRVTVNDQELEKLVKDIDTSKSSSILNISSKVLKDAFMVLIPHLVYMYNLSFEKGCFPDSWKTANVVPLKKGGGSHRCE